MKHKIFLFLINLVFISLLILIIGNKELFGEIYAWDNCPKGMVNDEYPGSCPLYVDTDENGICDHSEPAPKDRVDNQDLNKETIEKQTKDPIILDNNKKDKDTLTNNVILFLSIFIPLIVLLTYAGLYKIKQSKKT